MFSLPKERLIAYASLFALLPSLLFLPIWYKASLDELKDLKNQLEKVVTDTLVYEQKQAVNHSVRRYFSGASPTFLNEKLEQKPLLEKERLALEKIASSSAFTGNERFEKRAVFLKQNRIALQEADMVRKEGITESLFTFMQPVEMDHADLKEVLGLLEEKKPLAPQLLLTKFQLTKKQTPMTGEVYETKAHLLKREFTP
jgi:hypothetical protein